MDGLCGKVLVVGGVGIGLFSVDKTTCHFHTTFPRLGKVIVHPGPHKSAIGQHPHC